MNWKKIINNPQQFLIAFEIGHNQKKALIELLKKTQLMPLAKFYKDYSRKDRILIIQNRKNVS
jgi:methylase of polypeptide subunit release factors